MTGAGGSGVGIVGTGISGLTLALLLQREGVETTVYSPSTPDGIRRSRLPNTVARFEPTLARERELGVDHWAFPDCTMTGLSFYAGVDPPVGFFGRSAGPIQAVDFRVLLPRFLEDYLERGGRLEVTEGEPAPADVERWSERHELIVVAVGRGSMATLFPRDPARSPYDRPQRRLCAALLRGIDLPDPLSVSFNVAPGAGEIFQMAVWSAEGMVSNLLIEAVPGGPLERLAEMRPDDDPAAFCAEVERLVAAHCPPIAERVHPGRLELLGPLDVLQGAVTPTVRRGWAPLGTGRFAVAVGDAWITNDPITGQGANLGSQCAWLLGRAVAAGGPYDEGFCQRVEAAMWEYAEPVTMWTNAFLGPPPPHVFGLLGAAASDPRVAAAFIDLFSDPPAMWRTVSSPDGVRRAVEAATAGDGDGGDQAGVRPTTSRYSHS